MRPLALCLLLASTALFGAEETKPKVITATPVERPLPSEKTKLPWHMVNLWWTMPETADFESLEIDVTISDDVDPSKLNLYIAPIGLGQLNDTNFYGGIQSNIGGYPVSDASPQGDYHKGKGAIFSRWGNKDIDTSFVRPALNGLTEAAGYEGDFASGRRPFPWKAGTYTYAIRKLTYEKDKDGKKVVIADLPKLEVRIGMPRINGQPIALKTLSVNYPKNSGPASPAIMSTELAEGGKEVICRLHNEILTREKWSFPLLPAPTAK